MSSSLVHLPHVASNVLVKQSPFFSSLPNALLNEMSGHFRLQHWKKGDLINPDVLLSHFYFLQEGQLEMKRSNPDTGREVTLSMLYPGDSFDIITLLDGKAHEIDISPITNLQVISVPIEMMRKWLWTYPELNQQFLPYLAHKMREQENLATSFALHDITTRLSRILLKHINNILAYTGAKDVEHKEHLISGLTDETLARMAGSVRQVINKQLQFWKSQGILNKKRNQIIINDLEALSKEAHFTQSSFKERQ